MTAARGRRFQKSLRSAGDKNPGVRLTKLSLITNAAGQVAGPPELLAQRAAALAAEAEARKRGRARRKAAVRLRAVDSTGGGDRTDAAGFAPDKGAVTTAPTDCGAAAPAMAQDDTAAARLESGTLPAGSAQSGAAAPAARRGSGVPAVDAGNSARSHAQLGRGELEDGSDVVMAHDST